MLDKHTKELRGGKARNVDRTVGQKLINELRDRLQLMVGNGLWHIGRGQHQQTAILDSGAMHMPILGSRKIHGILCAANSNTEAGPTSEDVGVGAKNEGHSPSHLFPKYIPTNGVVLTNDS